MESESLPPGGRSAARAAGAGAVAPELSRAVTDRLIALLAAMRRQGAHVGSGELIASHRALAAVDPANHQDARAALRCVLCSRHDDLERFERAFASVFADVRRWPAPEGLERLGTVPRPEAARAMLTPGAGESPGEQDEKPVPAAWSEVELLLHKDFAEYTEAERVLARELMRRLALRGPTRRSRRTRQSRRRAHAVDLRALVRASLRTGGEPVQRRWRARTERPRPVVMVCDVSGSMAPYARMLLQYLHACVAARRRVEAFAFGTHLTRITVELAGRDHDLALQRAVGAVTDLASGTRIGAALAELNRTHGRRVGRGAIVVILSDGWDRGEPQQLADEIARLRRSAHRLVWLNPLAAHPDYEPLTRGMRAAIPYVDDLLAGNSLQSLQQLADVLENA
jgi:uncharacterized protein with von Willebrand factor type A (vWA) domain